MNKEMWGQRSVRLDGAASGCSAFVDGRGQSGLRVSSPESWQAAAESAEGAGSCRQRHPGLTASAAAIVTARRPPPFDCRAHTTTFCWHPSEGPEERGSALDLTLRC